MGDFMKAALVSDIAPGKSQIIEVSETKVALFNQDGNFYAINNSCIHKQGPLGEGELEGDIVTCPLHGWKYDITSGQCTTNPNAKVTCYEVKVDGQDILVKL